MSVEAPPAPVHPPSPAEHQHGQLPPYATQAPEAQGAFTGDLFEAPAELRNDLETDVAIPLPEDYYTNQFYADAYTESAPQTSEDFTQRWGQLQGAWTKLKAGLYGATVGRVRAWRRGEGYDASKHNRVVQNEMYKSVGVLAVREHLAAHDTERFATYAAGKSTRSERLRMNLEDLGAVSILAGATAIRGIGNFMMTRSELGPAGAYAGLAMREKAGTAIKKFSKTGKNQAETLGRQTRVESIMDDARQRARSRAVPPPR